MAAIRERRKIARRDYLDRPRDPPMDVQKHTHIHPGESCFPALLGSAFNPRAEGANESTARRWHN